MNKFLSLSVIPLAATATVASVMMASAPAQALTLKMVLSDVTTSDGANVTGSFHYTLSGVYSAFNITSNPGTIVTTGGNYTPASLTGAATILGAAAANTDTSFSIQSASDRPFSLLRMYFDKDLDTMTDNSTASIIPGTTFPALSNSYEVYSESLQNNQLRTITGGIITAQVVPEPLTILGTGLALGFGGLFKSKSSKKQSVKA